MLSERLGILQDFDLAMQWYLRAVELNNTFAMRNIGSMYENGLGVEKNMDTARQWYQKADESLGRR